MGKIFDALKKSSGESGNLSKEKIEADVNLKLKRFKKEILEIKKDVSNIYRKPDRNLITILDPRSFEAEQFKLLRTSILFPASGVPPKVIMVTSAVPGEGKSFVASNLAVSIAQNIDDHVLLMDCDLRLPTIHRFFGIQRNVGLSEYLSGDAELSSLFVKTGINKLAILPGGEPPSNPSELLSSDHMSNLIKEVKSRYEDRYIIMDSSPPRLTAESSALAKKADGILLVINYDSTNRNAVTELIDILGKDKILGVVINRFDMRSQASYGYGEYSKYYSK